MRIRKATANNIKITPSEQRRKILFWKNTGVDNSVDLAKHVGMDSGKIAKFKKNLKNPKTELSLNELDDLLQEVANYNIEEIYNTFEEIYPKLKDNNYTHILLYLYNYKLGHSTADWIAKHILPGNWAKKNVRLGRALLPLLRYLVNDKHWLYRDGKEYYLTDSGKEICDILEEIPKKRERRIEKETNPNYWWNHKPKEVSELQSKRNASRSPETVKRVSNIILEAQGKKMYDTEINGLTERKYLFILIDTPGYQWKEGQNKGRPDWRKITAKLNEVYGNNRAVKSLHEIYRLNKKL